MSTSNQKPEGAQQDIEWNVTSEQMEALASQEESQPEGSASHNNISSVENPQFQSTEEILASDKSLSSKMAQAKEVLAQNRVELGDKTEKKIPTDRKDDTSITETGDKSKSTSTKETETKTGSSDSAEAKSEKATKRELPGWLKIFGQMVGGLFLIGWSALFGFLEKQVPGRKGDKK